MKKPQAFKRMAMMALVTVLSIACSKKAPDEGANEAVAEFMNELNNLQTSNGQVAVPTYNSVGLVAAGAGPGAGHFQKPCASRPGMAHPDQGSGNCAGNNYFEVDIPTTGISLSYNSQSSKLQMGFGAGFSLSIDERFFSNSVSNQYYLVRGDGSIISHHKSVSGEWVSDDIRRAQSVFQASGTNLVQLLPEGEKAEFSLFASGESKHYVLSRHLDKNGNATTLVRNTAGQVTEIVDPYGSKIGISYLNGLASSLQDAAGNVYRLNYDDKKRLISFTQPDGRAATFAYKAHLAWVTEKKDANGKKLNYSYYISGDLESIKNELGYVTVLFYEPNEVKLKTLFDTEIEKFDAQGRIVSYSKNGVQTLYTRNGNGLLISETESIGRVTSYTYASTNGLVDPRPASITYPDNGGTTTFAQVGGLRPYPPSKITHVQGTMKSVITLDVNHQGVLSEVNGSNGQNVKTYAYDSKGNLLTVIQNGLTVERHTYNSRGEVLSSTDEKGMVTSYTYSQRGDLSSETDHFGRMTSYQYDALGKVIETVTSTVKYSQEYNSVGEGVATSVRANAGGGDISIAAQRTYDSNGTLSTYQLIQKASSQIQLVYEEIYKSIAGQLESRNLRNTAGQTYNLDQ